VAYGAARSLGTRVVTFKVQNGKLFIFDAADGHKDSDTFDPSLIVDAYPVVTGVLAGGSAQNFVVFDPAAGMNRFNALSDAFSGAAVKFQIELSWLQRFRKIADGVTFEQVFTGYADAADPNAWMLGENNAFRASGTLGIALRKYSEGAGYKTSQVPDQGEYYFRSDLKLVPNSGQAAQSAVKWNIQPGMKPIKWLISDHVLSTMKDPQYAQYDVMGALKNAIVGWNEVFGFRVLEAAVATPNDSFGDDDTNYVLWDEDPSYGAAFANWRNNPNTGEIRGASVYMSIMWLQIADQSFSSSMRVRGDGTPELLAAPSAAKKIPTLAWEGIHEQPLCVLRAESYLKDPEMLAAAASTSMTKKQKVEAFLTHVLMHEIGHTLGLRHNFKGSLMPPSSSVMDYLTDDDSINRTTPGAYDVDAVKYLYGLSSALPSQPFCTDQDVGLDPDCNMFDTGAVPLDVTYAPRYQGYLAAFLNGQVGSPPNNSLNGMLQYVKDGSPDQAASAWATVISPIKVPVAAALLAQPGYAARVDAAARRVLSRLLLDPPQARGYFFDDLTPLSAAYGDIFREVQNNLLNGDGARSFTTRRATVDILRKMQSLAAYDALLAARAQIAATRSGLTGDAAALTDDLLARIDAATHPYFN
ncbi:MAG TPA: zinc-dependent metalloprotease, partial [Myxococcales bacterium]